ncbi:MAG: carbon-nitrogen hydrolase family protein [Acidilobaceae archaeon]
MSRARIALVQFGALRSKRESLNVIEKLLGEYEGKADIIVFPEYSMLDPTGLEPTLIYESSETLDGGWVRFFRDLASTRDSCIVSTLFERSREPPRVYNSVVVLNRGGELLGVYRKTHLFDILGYRESSFTAPGDKLFDPVNACGVRLGLAVCFEIRYPEIFRVQALRGAELVVVPAAWYRGPLKEETLGVLARARAHENNLYVAVAAQYGDNFTGRSVLVDPMGVAVVDAGSGEKIVEAIVDTEIVYRVRARMPLLELAKWDMLLGHLKGSVEFYGASKGSSSYVK